MPYDTPYNEEIAHRVHQINQRKVDYENAMHGGSGFAAATHLDLGIGTPSLGVRGSGMSGGGMTGGDWNDVVRTVGHVAETVEPYARLGALALGAGKKPRRKKGAGMSGGTKLGFSGQDLPKGDAPINQPIGIQPPQASPEKSQFGIVDKAEMPPVKGGGVSGGKKRTIHPSMAKRAEIVKKIMREKGLTLPQASTYVKQNNLWKK